MFEGDTGKPSIITQFMSGPRGHTWDASPMPRDDTAVCLYTSSTPSEPPPPTSYLYFDRGGEVHEMVSTDSPGLLCYNQRGLVPVHRRTWTPYFDEIFVSPDNVTELQDDAVLQLKVWKLGAEGERLFPFGDAFVDIRLPTAVEFTFHSDDGRTGTIAGTVGRNVHGVSTITVAGLEQLPCPLQLHAVILLDTLKPGAA